MTVLTVLCWPRTFIFCGKTYPSSWERNQEFIFWIILFYFMRHFLFLFLGFTPSPGPKGEQLICMPQRYTQQCLYVYVLIVGRRDSVLADLRERQNKARPKATALSFEVVNSWSGHNLRARTEYEMPRWEQAEQKKKCYVPVLLIIICAVV